MIFTFSDIRKEIVMQLFSSKITTNTTGIRGIIDRKTILIIAS